MFFLMCSKESAYPFVWVPLPQGLQPPPVCCSIGECLAVQVTPFLLDAVSCGKTDTLPSRCCVLWHKWHLTFSMLCLVAQVTPFLLDAVSCAQLTPFLLDAVSCGTNDTFPSRCRVLRHKWHLAFSMLCLASQVTLCLLDAVSCGTSETLPSRCCVLWHKWHSFFSMLLRHRKTLVFHFLCVVVQHSV